MVELREYFDCGDYTEEHYDFDTKEKCLQFARENKADVYAIHDYEDRNYDPINLSIWT
jgi:hypothetical protein